MRKWFTIRRLGFVLAALLLVTGSVVLICWDWRIWGPTDFRAYQEVSRYPLGQDLWFGRITAGQNIDSVVSQAPPHSVVKFGQFTLVNYYASGPRQPGFLPMESMTIIAKDGKLIAASAGGCTWARTFFSMSTTEEAECKQAFARHLESRL
jgi:hypothetical protein